METAVVIHPLKVKAGWCRTDEPKFISTAITGWWFGTWLLFSIRYGIIFFHIGNVIIPTDYFSEGEVNHQPGENDGCKPMALRHMFRQSRVRIYFLRSFTVYTFYGGRSLSYLGVIGKRRLLQKFVMVPGGASIIIVASFSYHETRHHHHQQQQHNHYDS